jgi:predicted amidohydrolase
MSRRLTLAAAQLGPIQKAEGRDVAVGRMVRLMETAHRRGAEIVVFPELALTTFFPRWYEEDLAEADHWYEAALPSNATAPLFDAARRYGIAFHLGYAEKTLEGRRFNTAVFVDPSGALILKYRKVHLPGHAAYDPVRRVQHLEKRYFEPGDLGFPVIRAPVAGADVNVGLMICNDRRWPEAWRVLGLQQVELVMLGYNTPSLNMENRGFEAHHLRVFHSHLSIQAGAYQNACFAVATAKAGTEDGHELFGHSIIVNPQGEIMAQATTWEDELIVAEADLGMCELGRRTIFAFERHRRPEHYRRIVDQVGSMAPPAWRREHSPPIAVQQLLPKESRDEAIAKLRREGAVEKVLQLQAIRQDPSLAEDPNWRRSFVGYYRLGRQAAVFYEAFFAVFRRCIRDPGCRDLVLIMEELLAHTGRRHLSFTSKLLATIDPAWVVYDRNVASFFGVPLSPLPAKGWQAEARSRYAAVETGIRRFVGDAEWPALRSAFDNAFPQGVGLSDYSKADLLIWAAFDEADD